AIAEDRAASADSCRRMRQILRDQRLRNGIPARLPDGVELASKTGDISTVVHDTGIVSPLAGERYTLTVMTEGRGYQKGRYGLIARLARAVHEVLVGA